MASSRSILKQINQLVACLVEKSLLDDFNYAILKQNDREVTFPGSEQISFTLKNTDYAEIYNNLILSRAYLAKFPDGALLLMRYLYDNQNKLQQSSLGFYPSPDLEQFQNDPDLYLEDVVYAEVIARNIVPFPIRFDFDCREGSYKSLKHPKSHLTLGQYKNCRIPITSPLTPYQFIDFLLRNFYNTAFCEYQKDLPFFSDFFDDCIELEERQIIHVSNPVPFDNRSHQY